VATILWHAERFIAKTKADMDRSVRRVALTVEKEAERGMRAPKHGENMGPRARRSAPGEPPAVQTANLFGSIVVEKLGQASYRVGSPVPYGYFLEFGTRPFTITPKKAKALHWVGQGGEDVFATVVHHPGITARPWLRPAMLKVKALCRGMGFWKGPRIPGT